MEKPELEKFENYPSYFAALIDYEWYLMEWDAFASDGPISDRDVKDAIKHARPKITALIREQLVDEMWDWGHIDDDTADHYKKGSV